MRIDISGLLRSFSCAARGVRLGLRERNFRIHLTAVCYVTVAAVLAELSRAELAALFLCFGLVTATELVNTAVEKLCDRVTTQRDPRIRDVKDIAAGAVLLTAASSVAVGIVLFCRPAVISVIRMKLAQHIWLDAALILSIPLAVRFVFAEQQKGEPK